MLRLILSQIKVQESHTKNEILKYYWANVNFSAVFKKMFIISLLTLAKCGK